MKIPYRPDGMRQICPYCKVSITRNAMGRASHERSKAHHEAVERRKAVEQYRAKGKL